MADRTRVIGLTGGIASGKSSVATMLREHGAAIVDADLVARDIVLPGSHALAEIAETFGDEVLRDDGSLDRKKLGAIIFADDNARRTLNQITHPRIAQESARRIAELAAGNPVVIYEAALIVENGLHHAMAGLIVVSVDRQTQLARLAARDSISAEAAAARIDSQLPLAEKTAVADFVIDNSGSLAETAQQVAELWQKLSAPTGKDGDDS